MKGFIELKKKVEKIEAQREELIALSREIVRLSKQAIYSGHRNDLKSADKALVAINKKLTLMRKYPIRDEYSGSIKIAVQEYVEAVTFIEFLKKQSIPTASDLKVEPEHYLLGLCDLTGELVRLAINSSINKNFDLAIKIKDFVTDLYGELLQFDFRNGEVRRKFDGVKYDLRKLEDLVLELKLNG